MVQPSSGSSGAVSLGRLAESRRCQRPERLVPWVLRRRPPICRPLGSFSLDVRCASWCRPVYQNRPKLPRGRRAELETYAAPVATTRTALVRPTLSRARPDARRRFTGVFLEAVADPGSGRRWSAELDRPGQRALRWLARDRASTCMALQAVPGHLALERQR